MTEYSSPPPAASNTVNKLPPRTQRKSQSRVWDHFTPNPESTSKRDKCNHCQSSIKCDNGTSSMLAHSKTCYNAEQISQVFDFNLATIGGMEGIQSESQETHSSDHYGYCQFLQSTESSGCITDQMFSSQDIAYAASLVLDEE
ncbi:hypothetical protein GmHk_05G012776 [Glycine max]|nr:hypothetical protein GmHk_05G012776 [Glycine max]